MSSGFLNVHLNVDKNLTLKSFYHYLVKFYKKNSLNVFMVGFPSKNSPSLLTYLHLKLLT
jgi:hypothetical protein